MASSQTPQAGTAEYQDCYARWSAEELILGNAAIERRWRILDGTLRPVSLLDKQSGAEWLREEAAPALLPPMPMGEGPFTVSVTGRVGEPHPASAPALLIQVAVADGEGALLTYHLQLFPAVAAFTGQLQLHRVGSFSDETPEVEKVVGDERSKPVPSLDVLEILPLSPAQLRLRQVTLHDITDRYNELMQEATWLLHTSELRLRLSGNVFVIEDVLGGRGMVLVKQAPLPPSRPVKCPADLTGLDNRTLAFLGHGLSPEEPEGNPYTVLLYTGGEVERIRVMQAWQRRCRPYVPGRDGRFLSNTWGDRGADSRISDDFMRQEIDAAAELGVEVVQIDYGWAIGRLSDLAATGQGLSAWKDFRGSNPDFWKVDPARFPQGLAPVMEKAHAQGMQCGLWFVPDPHEAYARWEEDAELLLDFYRTMGILYFKIDGTNVPTPRAAANLARFFDRVLTESKGEITFDLDITAGVRPSYFGPMHIGPLFVENRYTDWHNYWPHQTLRMVWQLAHYIDPVRMRVECLNGTRNADRYDGDPLGPATYPADYLFAITMVANPLGWFEISNLPGEVASAIGRLAYTWRSHRDRLHQGTILPIGAAPDGTSFTGFASVDADGKHGYLLLFRELTEGESHTMPVPFWPGNPRLTPLAGEGLAELRDGQLEISIPHAQRYLFLQVEC
jgi:alpha-galactosidase